MTLGSLIGKEALWEVWIHGFLANLLYVPVAVSILRLFPARLLFHVEILDREILLEAVTNADSEEP